MPAQSHSRGKGSRGANPRKETSAIEVLKLLNESVRQRFWFFKEMQKDTYEDGPRVDSEFYKCGHASGFLGCAPPLEWLKEIRSRLCPWCRRGIYCKTPGDYKNEACEKQSEFNEAYAKLGETDAY